MSRGVRLPSSLRLLTQRIAETPPEQLHYHASSLIALLHQFRIDSERHQSGKSSSAPDETVSLHKFKTQLSALLQSKQVESRWLAVILVKTYLEIGDFEALQSSGQWVRTIAAFIGHKTEHFIVKKASIVTLTKVFFLSYKYPNIVREITTPVLQPFITHCLTSIGPGEGHAHRIQCQSELLDSVLQSIALLVPRHPASLRPHLKDIRPVLSQLINPTVFRGDAFRASPTSTALARHLLSLLPNCAPKNGAAEEWSKNFQTVLQHASRTADHVLRAAERMDAVASNEAHYASVRNFKGTMSDEISDFLGLPPWHGVSEGIDRLIACLHILDAFLATSNQSTLALPVSQLWNTLQRLLSISGPFFSTDGETIIPSTNAEVGRDERETLWANLPLLHEITFTLLLTVLERVGRLGFALAEQVLEKIAWAFEREGKHTHLRLVLYRSASQVMSVIGPSLGKDHILNIRLLLTTACSDSQDFSLPTVLKDTSTTASKVTRGSILGQSQATELSHLTIPSQGLNKSVQFSALRLLADFVSSVQSNLVPRALRASIDKAIIIAQDEPALVASVLNPDQRTINGKQMSSNLVFLSRANPANDEVEALVRPRLPIIRGSHYENIDTEMDIDKERYHQDDSMQLGLEHSLPTFNVNPTYEVTATSSRAATEPSSIDKEFDEPVIIPKRPRDSQDGSSASVGAAISEPLNKRIKESDTATSPLDQPSQEDAVGDGIKGTEPADDSNPNKSGVGNDTAEDFEIPPIQMPSDFEDSDEDDEE